MTGKIHPIRLGLFVFIGTMMIIAAIFLIGNKESLFSKTFIVKTYFTNTEGLRKGAPVRLSGIDVGSVKNIEIVKDTLGNVEVTLRLHSDVQRFIKTDTKATIESEGLVGNKVLVLLVGSSGASEVQNGGVIQGLTPLGFGQIVEEARGTVEYTKDMARNLAEIVQKVNEGEGSIGKLVNDNDLYYSAVSLVRSADKSLGAITTKLDTLQVVVNSLLTGVESVVSNVDKVVIDVDNVIADVKAGKGLLGKFLNKESDIDSSFHTMMSNLITITQSTKDGAEKFAENMEALKRNWLFKSYFEQRGFYDKTSYEKELDSYLVQITERIKVLDDRIETLKKLK